VFTLADLDSATVRATWQRDGFVHVRGVLDQTTTDSLSESVLAMAERKRAAFPDQPLSDQGAASVRMKNILEESIDFDELVVHPEVIPILEWFLGAWFKLLGSEAFTRAEESEYLLPFHTDGGPLLQRVIPTPESHAIQLKVQFFLTDADRPDSGQLLVIPGSHLRMPAISEANCYVEEANSHVQDGGMPPGAVAVPARTGDITIHTHSLWHAVGPNPAGAIRRSVILRYGQPWCTPHDYERYNEDVLGRFAPETWRYLGHIEDGSDPASVYKPPVERVEPTYSASATS
jgi:ectoine hydroxylase-related dioxygenase (phytanoyl-CoA dioxygenase family)